MDIPAATRLGVYVANVPSSGTGNAESMAELAIFLMLALARQYPRAQELFRQRRLAGPLGRAWKGRTAAIIGFGGPAPCCWTSWSRGELSTSSPMRDIAGIRTSAS
ncbi:MAG: hypothetical protein ACRDZO_14440 [Egibacteraceae bacterium]